MIILNRGENMEISKFFSKVFVWMFIGLAITFCTGTLVASNPKALELYLDFINIFLRLLQLFGKSKD